VTLNTAILDKELSEAVRYADFLYSINADALIVSDLGLAKALSGRYKDMSLHASTQASGHNAECAEKFKELGFDRMVCARELSFNDIKELVSASPIEIEQFVHGAICVSQSGQCLASLVMGGRSGNRGVCAQPCRMKYNGTYPLSMKDLCLASHIEELIESGVASLKIEGRMKSPAYVYEVVRTYRALLDSSRNATEKELSSLASVFSRSGFTDGYYTEKIDGSMNGIRTESDINASKNQVTVFKKLERGLPAITVKEREAPSEFLPPKKAKAPDKKQKPICTARFLSPSQITETGFFSHVYLPLEKYEAGVADGIVFPPSVFPTKKQELYRALERAVRLGATNAIICHIGQLEIAKEFGLIPHGDFRLNVFNTLSAQHYISDGMRDVILSPELTLPQMRDISAPKAAIVYGRLPIMLLTKPVEGERLIDKTGAVFPIIKEWGSDVLLNSVPFYMADREKMLSEYGIRGRHFIFTTESKKECAAIISAYKNGLPPVSPEKIRRIAK
jgi:collagenase-like PrtC family protease